jgi:hypothetical protein
MKRCVAVGDIVNHPQYGGGLVVERQRFNNAGWVSDPRTSPVTWVCTILWSSGIVDSGWPEGRLLQFVI